MKFHNEQIWCPLEAQRIRDKSQISFAWHAVRFFWSLVISPSLFCLSLSFICLCIKPASVFSPSHATLYFSRYYSDALTQSQCHQFSLLLSFLKFLTALLSWSSSVLSALFLALLQDCFILLPFLYSHPSSAQWFSQSLFIFFSFLCNSFEDFYLFFIFCHPTHTVDLFLLLPRDHTDCSWDIPSLGRCFLCVLARASWCTFFFQFLIYVKAAFNTKQGNSHARFSE